MRRGTTLAMEIEPRLLDAAKRGRPKLRQGWDEELTELDLRLDPALLAPAPQVVTIRPFQSVFDRDDEDLPMLDPSEYVATLALDDLDPTRMERGLAPARKKPAPRRPPPPARTPRNPRSPRREAPKPPPRKMSRWLWASVLVPLAAIMFVAWAFRMELVRYLGLI